jgi:hypothetical protein
LDGLAAGHQGDQVAVAGGDGSGPRSAPPPLRKRGVAVAHRDTCYIAGQLRDHPLRPAVGVQALQVGGKAGQQRVPVGRRRDLVGPRVGDAVPIVSAGLRGIGSEQHDCQSQPNERPSLHVVCLLRGA